VAWHAVRAFDAAGPLISRSRGSCVRFTSGSDLSPSCRPELALRSMVRLRILPFANSARRTGGAQRYPLSKKPAIVRDIACPILGIDAKLHYAMGSCGDGRSCRHRYMVTRDGYRCAPAILHADLPGGPLGCPALVVKIFLFSPDPNHFYNPRRPGPQRGVGHRHERWGGMRWTRQRWRVMGSQGGFYLVSDHQARRRTTVLRTVKSCGPDASTPASSPAEASRPDRA
jgi:hypothetical protein